MFVSRIPIIPNKPECTVPLSVCLLFVSLVLLVLVLFGFCNLRKPLVMVVQLLVFWLEPEPVIAATRDTTNHHLLDPLIYIYQ